MNLSGKYPCEKCLVRPMCEETCLKRERYKLIIGILSIFIFYVVGVTQCLFIFLPFAEEQRAIYLLSIWSASIVIMFYILRKEDIKFHFMIIFISPMFVSWYFIIKILIFTSERILNYVESL